MSEDTDRPLLRQVLLEAVPPPAPDLEHRVRQRLLEGAEPAEEGRTHRLLPLVAAFMAGLAVATLLLGNRLINQQHAPATTPPPVVTSSSPARHGTRPPAVVDPTSCSLPVKVLSESGPPAKLATEVGFVDTRTGQYSRDGSATVAGLPGGGSPGTDMKAPTPAGPVEYSTTFGRWLPVGPPAIAPDGMSYVWVKLLPEGSTYGNFQTAELHRYDVATAKDRTLWSYAGSITIHRWDAAGVLVDTVPPKGGRLILWLIDPVTAAAAQQPISADPRQPARLPGDPGGFSSFGIDAQGGPIFRIGSRSKGDQEWIFYESAPGVRVTIYRGVQGDATGFDPFGVAADSTGIWFGDYDSPTIWHWREDTGLTKVTVTGLPAPLPGPNSAVYVNPAGPCS